jgi:hypothetical protein
LPRWQRFATRVLGLASTSAEPDGTMFLRMDDNHHRFALHPGSRNDLAYAGWEALNEAGLHAIAERLQAQGAAAAWGTATEATARRVASAP